MTFFCFLGCKKRSQAEGVSLTYRWPQGLNMRQSLSAFSSENPSDGEEGTASEPSPSGTPDVGSTNTDERPDERSDDMCSQGSEIPLDQPATEVVAGPAPSLPIQHHDLLKGEQVSNRNSQYWAGKRYCSFETYWGNRCREDFCI